jgi:hypothetical protein
MGETLESAYDDEYKPRRSESLRAAGIHELRLEVVPDAVAVQQAVFREPS